MRIPISRAILLALAGCLMLTLTYGQDRSGGPAPLQLPNTSVPQRPAVGEPAHDFAKLTPFQRQMMLSCQGGADWLFNMNGVKGRFLHGYLPALKTGLEGDNYLRQAGAAYALAKAARVTGQERFAVRATQALLSLLDETYTDQADPQVRCTMLPSVVVNRLGAAGILVAAIHELPKPQADLLEKAEQLCNFIRQQARADGSLKCNDIAKNDAPDDPASVVEYPGLALFGLMRSQSHVPAAWKMDLVKKSVAFYQPWWRQHRDRGMATALTAAYAEAFFQEHDKAVAECVFEMNDWLGGLQYQPDVTHPLWTGGFRGWADGQPLEIVPGIDSACCTESLIYASRVARECVDVTRYQAYIEKAERSLQFLTTLQFTEGNTQHYADWYRPRLVGAFYASHQDGNLRIDYAQHAVSAMGMYLE